MVPVKKGNIMYVEDCEKVDVLRTSKCLSKLFINYCSIMHGP